MRKVINAHKLFKNKYDNVKPFYKHRNIFLFSENMKPLQERFMWKLFAKNIQTL